MLSCHFALQNDLNLSTSRTNLSPLAAGRPTYFVSALFSSFVTIIIKKKNCPANKIALIFCFALFMMCKK